MNGRYFGKNEGQTTELSQIQIRLNKQITMKWGCKVSTEGGQQPATHRTTQYPAWTRVWVFVGALQTWEMKSPPCLCACAQWAAASCGHEWVATWDQRQAAVMIMRPSALQRLNKDRHYHCSDYLDIILLQKHDEVRVSCASEVSYVEMSNIASVHPVILH